LKIGGFWQLILWFWQFEGAIVGTRKEAAMKNNLFLNSVVVLVVLVILWVFRNELSDMWVWFSSMEAVATSMREVGAGGMVMLFVLFVLQVFLAFIPGQALMVACGYLYGFWGGFLLSWFSLVIGGELAYLLARKYGRPFAERWIAPDVLSRWDRAAQGQGVSFFTVTLVMPLVPNDAMCYVAGLGTITHRRFAIANLLGRGMACVLTSAAGTLGGSLPWQGWGVLIALFLLIGVVWHFARLQKSSIVVI
jgi:uncharacterized membrane protein YdjX (TVP38/TMEM64 family)